MSALHIRVSEFDAQLQHLPLQTGMQQGRPKQLGSSHPCKKLELSPWLLDSVPVQLQLLQAFWE